MNGQKRIKEIDLHTLDQTNRRSAPINRRRLLGSCAVVLLLSGGVFAAYHVVVGDVVNSRFTVNKLNCPGCVTTVQEVTGQLPGVISTDVSLAGQAVTVTHRSNRTSSDALKGAMIGAGYEVRLDVVYHARIEDSELPVVALVNNRPLFGQDMKLALEMETENANPAKEAAAFFTMVGRELLLKEADALSVAVQPFEVERAVEALRSAKGVSRQSFEGDVAARYGAGEKFHQAVAQDLAIRKLFSEHVLKDVSDPGEKERKLLEWTGNVFKTANVRIADAELRNQLRQAAEFDDWKAFWPRMIGRNSRLKTLLTQ